MRDPIAAPATGATRQRLGPITERVRAAFELMSQAILTIPRSHPEMALSMRGPLGRLVAAGQNRDTFDQRITHIEAAMEAACARPADQRVAAFHVVAQQLVELARLLEQTSAIAAKAFGEVLAAVDRRNAVALSGLERERREMLGEIGRKGLHAATDLAAAGEVLGAEAEGVFAGVDRNLSRGAIEGADLAWMMALYTMEDERRVHRQAIARVVADLA
ncbi:hypothetical protein LNKW23_29550 [Paralimibaculum aggregatum]|uniref:DUF47 family protein n=1 Tax=Paralimibaculum aggregatum TaxID=3036245 RepID=A0ABQ6LL80_9RHOB|nr:hypothetical protein [Limibaculum sp. NKW23]GMG83742.1 hypothetical protein LNKW23_29550 [Limibaculum sp. NKW23]